MSANSQQVLSKHFDAKHNCYAVVRNIPAKFRSADLRSYFSQLIEESAFSCFHYKHRPEVVELKNENNSKTMNQHKQTCVCVVKFFNSEVCDRCISMYHGTNWIDKTGEYLKERCVILKFTLSSSDLTRQNLYLTRHEKSHMRRHAAKELFSGYDLNQISELQPPVKVMPNGNVGTPTIVFQNLISQCKLPSAIIKKLGLVFPKTGSNRRYGNVPFEYDCGKNIAHNPASGERIKSLSGVNLGSHLKTANLPQLNKHKSKSFDIKKGSSCETEHTTEKEDSDSQSDNDECEEWERHEALHSDVTSQERSKERLFEEDIELKWEKGGSGLVFYTDAQFWAEEDGDFDEQTTDDWDVDMSEFYGGDGDRDAKDYVKFCKEKRLRSGQSTRKRASNYNHKQSQRIGDFEKHTKGIGGKIMGKLGWKEDQSLGSDQSRGLKEPISAVGQSSREKQGLGYYGEKLQSQSSSAATETYLPSKPGAFSAKKTTLRNLEKAAPVHRSVEPLASHSYMFPQFRSNLTLLRSTHKPRSATERKSAIPGVDGIVISTKYDEPLDVDEDSGILRSQYGTALKRRLTRSAETSTSHTSPGCSIPIEPVKSGSKLVKRCKNDVATTPMSDEASELPGKYPYISIPIKFVRPSNPDQT